MVGDVKIDTVHISIGDISIAPEAAGDIPEDFQGFFDVLREQIRIGAVPKIMGEDDYPVPGEVTEPDDMPTPEEQDEIDHVMAEEYVMKQAAIDSIARANHLRNVVSHVTPARKLEGFQTNHERNPRKRSAVNAKQAKELTMAETSLQRACALCIFENDCTLANSIGPWIDVHPYKDDKTGKHRPGSSPVREVESQTAFLESLDAGAAEKRQVHCDPAKRK
jgi:hypothetical protein